MKHVKSLGRLAVLVACIAAVVCTTSRSLFAQNDNQEDISKDASTEINVKNADISAIVRIFSRKTKRNYILDEKVRGKVSIYLPGKVTSDEALRILDSVLALKGFSTVPISENLWKIVPAKEARQSTIPTRTGERIHNPSSSVVTRLVTLKYVSAQDVQQIVSQLVSGDGLINAYTGTNSLIIIDAEDNIERLLQIIDQLDIPFSNREMTIIPIKHADVEDISQKLNEIMGTSKEQPDPAPQVTRASLRAQAQGRRANNNAGSTPALTSKTVAARGMEPKIIPDQRTNSLIVIADDETTARIRALVAQLDSKVDLSGNKFYVYRCQHANAEELSQVLAGLVGGGGSSTTPSAGGGSSLFGSNSQQQGALGTPSARSGASNRSGSPSRATGPTSTQLGENISITADPATNSLIIAASKPDFEKIRSLLSQIDVKRRQALVEATLLEVSIDDRIRSNTSFLTSTGGADGGAIARSDFSSENGLARLFAEPQNLQGLTLAAASAGSLSLPGGITVPSQSILVSAAQQNNNVNVLSAPTILATDNEEAQIVVGQNVPFLASTSTNAVNLNNTFNQVDRQDVGITLRITPQISSRDYVTLRVYTEVSALVLSTVNSALGPTTTKRQSETTIIAKDGQMIVTGGLIADDVSETDEGVPYLKDIPVLGHAFKSNSRARAQKNLLIFLTPRIIKDQFDARDSTIESTDKMRDVIAGYNVQPQRSETLLDDRINEVAESQIYTGPKPGTILPPSREGMNSMAPRIPQKENTTIILDGSGSGVLDLNSASRIEPNRKENMAATVSDYNSAEVRASLKSKQKSTNGSEAQFVVLEQLTSNHSENLPLKVSPLGRRTGIIIPKNSPLWTKRFFTAGERYKYQGGNGEATFRVLDVLATPSQVESEYPEVSSLWYTLSKTEAQHLGRGPWIKLGSH